ncbi:MinD/ParA family ATP-binding protein [Nocardia vaccinii]|uniref:MinD/ParA family ATP-binding protein n=1 Tax=Nocardia vaccinii TaxID=1822 RepID=UPI000B1BE3E5|nr:MinD/ParA family protein [Nocardia vaccinii]
MDRAPNNNGHTAGSVRARGGYDAYFTPPPGTGEVAVAETPQSDDRSNTTYTPGPPPHAAAPTVGAPGAVSWSQPESIAAEPNTPPRPQAEGPVIGEPAASAGYDRPASYERPAAAAQPSAQAGPAANASSAPSAQPAASPAQPPAAAQSPTTQSPAVSRVPDRIDRSHADRAHYDALPEVPRPTLTSMDLLAEIAATRRAQLRSSSGMRGALNKVGFNLGLSPAEQRTEDRRGRIRRQLTVPYQIAVLSVKGGVGRTTVTAALGSTFASLRPDRVIAVDANPDFGDLPARTSRHAYGLTLRDMVRTSRLESFSAVHSFTSINNADLSVLASPWNTEATEALSGQEYTAAIEVLRRHYNLVLVDCGTGVLDSVTTSVLQTSDAVLVVTPATVGGVKGAVATLNWLASHGLQHLIASSIVSIVHHQPAKPTVDVGHIEKLFATAQRPTFVMPYDEHLAEGGEIDLRLLESETALSFEELAAALADGFPSQVGGGSRDHGGWR